MSEPTLPAAPAWPVESTVPDGTSALRLAELDVAALERAARAVRQCAYAPYSRFLVGAAVLGDGRIFVGANVENASFGLTICAERSAVVQAVAAGVQRLRAVVVCTGASPPSSPCGMCRQVLHEFAEDPATFRVIAINPAGERREWTLAELLPDGFSKKELTDVASGPPGAAGDP
jgi:cytidine deaminase